MLSSQGRSFDAPVWAAGAGLSVLLVETLAAFWWGTRYPLPLWYFLLGLGIVVVLAGAIPLIFRGMDLLIPSPGRWLVLVCWTLLLLKVHAAVGTWTFWPHVILSLPFLAVLLPGSSRFIPRHSYREWSLLAVLVAVSSTDLYAAFAEFVQGTGIAAWSIAVGSGVLWTGFVLGLPYGVRLLQDVHRNETGRAALALLFLVLVTSMSWSSLRQTSPWSPHTYYAGKPPRVELNNGVSTRELPNVILIALDGLRYDSLTPERLEALPNLRKLRDDSLAFREVYSTSSWSLPAHASLFSGQLPLEHRAVSHLFSRLHPYVETLPQYLRAAGYRTLGFTGGGRINREHGFSRGFDTFWQMPDEHTGFVPGGIEYASLLMEGTRYRFPVVYRNHEGPSRRSFDPILRKATAASRNLRTATRPFFLFLQTHELTDYLRRAPDLEQRLKRERPRLVRPPQATEPSLPDPTLTRRTRKRMFNRIPSFSDTEWHRYRSRLKDFSEEDWERTLLGYYARMLPPVPLRRVKHRIGTLPESTWQEVSGWPQARINYIADWNLSALRGLRGLKPPELERRRTRYRYALERFDRKLGHLLKALKRHELYDESLLVFLSTHGEGFSRDPFVIGDGNRLELDRHGQVHDALIHVPLWVKLPHNRDGGDTYPGLLQITDLAPTLLDFLGIEGPLENLAGSNHVVDLPRSSSEGPGASRRIVRGSVESGKAMEPKLFVRTRRHKLTVDAGWELREYWRVPERSVRDLRPPRHLPPGVLRRLNDAMSRHVRDFFRHRNPYPRLQARGRELLRQFVERDRSRPDA